MRTPGAANLVTLLDAVETICPAVATHGRRVATYAVRLAAQYGLAPQSIETIRVGGLLHDIGKIQVPPEILAKPGRLNAGEWAELRTHPEIGCDLVARMGFGDGICEIVLYHHERYDGSGYPHRLAGSAINWAVRLVSVADAFDALTSARTYREALSVESARLQLAREAGSRYCPWVVSGLLSLPAGLLEPAGVDYSPTVIPDGRADPIAGAATRAWQAAAGQYAAR